MKNDYKPIRCQGTSTCMHTFLFSLAVLIRINQSVWNVHFAISQEQFLQLVDEVLKTVFLRRTKFDFFSLFFLKGKLRLKKASNVHGNYILEMLSLNIFFFKTKSFTSHPLDVMVFFSRICKFKKENRTELASSKWRRNPLRRRAPFSP